MRVYAIGDVHGQLDMLTAAHARIAADREVCRDPAAPVIHLGDYCDRGPDTAGVVQFLVDGIAAGRPWRAVMGNHDRLFRDFLMDGAITDDRLRSDLNWLSWNMGGRDTLRSYGIDDTGSLPSEQLHTDARTRIPEEHRQFLGKLETYIEFEDLILVHAGIRPGVPMQDQAEDDLVWIRDEFLFDTRDHGKLVVHGHTPVDTPTNYGNRVNLDTGAGYGRPLTAAVFEGRDCWVLAEGGREPLPPGPYPMF
ncbi:MAG: metallophosphoesterase [Rhodobacter sp.]|nr:metallophosphoesterase [Rhodobacter sp.]